jgi:hypothetical protein
MSAEEHRTRKHYPIAWAFMVALLSASSHGQVAPIQIPATTPLSIQLLRHVPMKPGESLEGRLLYPVYVENRMVIPAGAVLRGSVIQLDPDRSRRIHARLRGDFTPFHNPVVRFDGFLLRGGSLLNMVSDSTNNGVPILRLSPPPGQKKGSLISRQIAQEKQRLKDTAAEFTAPGRGDRLVQFLYTQLPYHPERIEAGTAWTVELAQPLSLAPVDLKPMDPKPMDPKPVGLKPKSDRLAHPRPEDKANTDPPAPSTGTEWRLRAYLQQTISSGSNKPGDTFQARVSEPVFDAQHTLLVPQGSLLVGEVTKTKPARSFGRQGKLRFRFRELKLPGGFSQPVEGTLAGVDANKSDNLQIDSEGGIAPKPQNRVILPLVLTLLATRAFDNDGSLAANGAVASNGFGIVGRVVGIAASSRNVAAGIGLYGAALALYDLWLARGHNVVFVKNTRIEVTTTPGRSQLNAPRMEEKPSSGPH